MIEPTLEDLEQFFGGASSTSREELTLRFETTVQERTLIFAYSDVTFSLSIRILERGTPVATFYSEMLVGIQIRDDNQGRYLSAFFNHGGVQMTAKIRTDSEIQLEISVLEK